MAPLEQEVLALNIINEGPCVQDKSKVQFVEAKTSAGQGQVIFLLPLPPGLGRSEWDLYKIWRNFDTGAIDMERDRAFSDSRFLEVRMKAKKEGFHRSIVAVHGKTGIALVSK